MRNSSVTRKATAHPPFSWRLLLTPHFRRRVPAPLNGPNVLFCHRASNAIWNGIKLLNLSPKDEILFPSYHCGIELDAVLKTGVRVKFYHVGRDAKVSAKSIEESIDIHTKAVFVIHYFGFPQDLSQVLKVCRREGLYLIEDCAHALYSRHGNRPIGSDGDFSVFSIWKTVPVPFGGALVVNNPALVLPNHLVSPGIYETARLMKQLIELRISTSPALDLLIRRPIVSPIASLVRRLNRTFSDDLWRQQPIGIQEFCVERGNWDISPICLWMLPNVREEDVISRRRAHFIKLLLLTRDSRALAPLYDDLPEGVCPLYFPAVVREPFRFQEHMKSAGIQAIRFWSEFHPRFPKEQHAEASFLKSNVVILPVHQCLSDAAFRQICEAVLSWRKGTEKVTDTEQTKVEVM